jgi:hypothetical protein
MEFIGEFETHITVCLNDSNRIENLQNWSRNHGLKCLHIVLDRGVTASQPMLTRHSKGNLKGELKIASDLFQSLNAAGFSVKRIKIEAAVCNQGVPQSNAEALYHSSNRYFEHHIKLLLEPSANILTLAEIAQRHSAHLSRNVLRIRSDNCYEQFITQRCLSVGAIEARQKFQALLDEIASLGHSVIEVEEEYVVYDSNLEIDAGWIQSSE